MNRPDAKFLDGLLKILSEAPPTQIDEKIVSDIKKFMSEEHTRDEKYDFIQNLTNAYNTNGISKFVAMVCNLEATFGEPIEPIVSQLPEPKEGEYIAVGWDGKPFIAKDESDESKITIDYILAHQDKDKDYDDVLTKIFIYMDDLMWAKKFDVVDEFILEFCKHDICFQYALCLLTCANWALDKLDNVELLKAKTIQAGTREIGKEDTLHCLHGLI